MLEKSKLRGADLITSILLILFGSWILYHAFHMPMKDTYGGVTNVWYVSPALFPLFIGFGIILLSLNILVHALKNGGFQSFKNSIQNYGRIHLSEKGYRFLGILVPLLSLVYMNLPRIDFFLSIVLFLIFIIPVFYFDDLALLKKLLVFYSAEMGLLFLLFLSRADKLLTTGFPYSIDILTLLLLSAFYIYIRKQIGTEAENRRKLRNALLISLLTPLILVPVFRFFLRVPLPKEGGIVDILFLLYYAIR
jgi:hypothetical protein